METTRHQTIREAVRKNYANVANKEHSKEKNKERL